MVEPTGYTALDLIGFTDKGPYDPNANYVRNDLVHVGNSTWRCKIDDTTGITPTEGANWTIFIESATSLAGMSDVTLTSPKNGDGLVHDGNDWENVPITTKEQWKKNGAYNLLPQGLYAPTSSAHGITYTVNADGSVSTSSTTKDSTNEAFVLFSRTLGYTVPAGQYLFCGKPSATKYRMQLLCTRGGVLTTLADLDYGTTSAVATIQGGDALQISITVKAGETGGDTFYPMLTTDLSATNADFVTPAKTNRELTEDTRKIITITDTMPSSAGNKSVGGCPTGYILIGADVYNTSNSRWDSMPIGVFADRPAYITSYTDSTTTYARPYLESGGVTPYGGQRFRALFMKA